VREEDDVMDASAGLLINAVSPGLLLGGFYAAVSIGVAISFGMLDIVNIAHPASSCSAPYVAFIGNTVFGIDPILATVILLPALLPARHGGLSGLLRGLRAAGRPVAPRPVVLLRHPVHRRGRADPGLRRRLSLGAGLVHDRQPPLYVDRAAVAAAGAVLLGMVMVVGLQILLARTFSRSGRQAVAQDQQALRLMAANPSKIKRIAFGLSLRQRRSAGPP
jgi:branched-chain amino acid transport system permease protein